MEIAAGSLNISKAAMADVFNVTRSAISKTGKRFSIEQDFVRRVKKKLSAISNSVAALQLHAPKASDELLRHIRQVVLKRSAVSIKAGRRFSKIDFVALKRIVRDIMNALLSPVQKEEVHAPVLRMVTVNGKQYVYGSAECLEAMEARRQRI